MSKLIKPVKINEIIARGKVIRSLKDLDILNYEKRYNDPILNDREIASRCCGVRRNIASRTLTVSAAEDEKILGFQRCKNINTCSECFLNANNYLNIHKYIKNHGRKQVEKRS